MGSKRFDRTSKELPGCIKCFEGYIIPSAAPYRICGYLPRVPALPMYDSTNLIVQCIGFPGKGSMDSCSSQYTIPSSMSYILCLHPLLPASLSCAHPNWFAHELFKPTGLCAGRKYPTDPNGPM